MKNANRAETSKEAKTLTVVAKAEKKLRAKGKPNAATVEASSGALSGETVGLNVGDRVSQFCRLDPAGEIAEEGRLHTTAAGVEKHFAKLPAAVIALEAGTHSGWIARLMKKFGHHVVVANSVIAKRHTRKYQHNSCKHFTDSCALPIDSVSLVKLTPAYRWY